MKSLSILITVLITLSGCIRTESREGSDQIVNKVITEPSSKEDINQVVSLSGAMLPPKKLTERVKQERITQLEKARKNYETKPDSLENIIWYGRRLAYLGRYADAIRIYSVGLDLFPESYKLYRHRGHRYLTIREFDKAIEDLQKAVFYARTEENRIEPDGLPNRKNIPLSNYKFNIWYHLGIAFYMKGNYDKALSSFKHCLEYSDNDDLLAANIDWFYMTYQKIGNQEAAKELLSQVDRELDIIEKYGYVERIKLYLGEIKAENIYNQAIAKNGALDPTLAYGAANWQLYNGQIEEGKFNLEKILKHPSWDSFAYIAAEVDMIALSNNN